MKFINFLCVFHISVNAQDRNPLETELSKEALGIICSYLDGRSLGALKATSSNMAKLLRDPRVCAESRKNHGRKIVLKDYSEFLFLKSCGLHFSSFELGFIDKTNLVTFLGDEDAQKNTRELRLIVESSLMMHEISSEFLIKVFKKFITLTTLNLLMPPDAEKSNAVLEKISPSLIYIPRLTFLWLEKLSAEKAVGNSIRPLESILPKLENLKGFVLFIGAFGQEEATILTKSLSHLKNIELLELGGANLSSDSAYEIVHSLKNLDKLRILSLGRNSRIGLNIKEIAPLFISIKNLHSLYLFDIGLNLEGVRFLSPQIDAMGERLKVLELGENYFGDDGMILLAPSLAKLKNLRYLGLRKNNLTHRIAPYLCSALLELKMLQALGLSWNDGLCKDFACFFAPVLSCFKDMEKLYLPKTGIFSEAIRTTENLKALVKLLKEDFPKLKVLNIQDNLISFQELKVIIQILGKLPGPIKLRYTKIGHLEEEKLINENKKIKIIVCPRSN